MKFNQSNIKKAKKYLDKNYCIGVPTETVYGLAANAFSSYAVKKIFKLKKRPKSNPLIVHYSNISNLKKDCLMFKWCNHVNIYLNFQLNSLCLVFVYVTTAFTPFGVPLKGRPSGGIKRRLLTWAIPSMSSAKGRLL